MREDLVHDLKDELKEARDALTSDELTLAAKHYI
jgi:hypothetical protein